MTLIELVQGAREIAAAIQSDTHRKNSLRFRDLERLLALLRSLYFSPSGTRLIIEAIAAGRDIRELPVPEILNRFNDFEYYGMREMHSLDFDYLEKTNLSLCARETIHRLRHGKGGLRVHVQELLNEPLTFNRPISQEDAQRLLTEITALNDDIQKVEEAVLDAMRSEIK